MNSYFQNPFLSPLSGDNATGGNGLACNFGGLSGRYDQTTAGQAFLCASGGNQGMTAAGQYANNTPSPNHQHQQLANATENSAGVCSRQDLTNGYDSQQNHIGSPQGHWNLPPQQQSPTDYSSQSVTTTDSNPLSATTTHSNYSTGAQSIPFYPWMGVVGTYNSPKCLFACSFLLADLLLDGLYELLDGCL